MTGDPTLLRRDYRRQLTRFLRGAKRAVRPWRIPNLGPSYNFHRNPFQRAGDEQNIESAEYANIVLDVIYYYEQARRARDEADLGGPRAHAARFGAAGAARLLDAQRLPELGHRPLPVPLAPVALLGVVRARACWRSPARRTSSRTTSAAGRSTCSTARWRCTSASRERWDDDRREPGSSLYGITTKFSEGRHFELARFQALAAEAVLRGHGRRPGRGAAAAVRVRPVDRAAGDHDADATTPRSWRSATAPSRTGGSTSRGWFDSRQRVISHIGGRAPAGVRHGGAARRTARW